MDRRFSVSLIFLGLIAGWALRASKAEAWTTDSRVLMADYALRITPPDLARQIDRHHKSYHAGIRAAAERDPSVRAEAALDRQEIIKAEVGRAVQSITGHKPFEEIVFRLGVVAYWVAGVNNPILWSPSGEPRPAYWNDYLHYLEDASQRYSVLYYANGRRFETAAGLDALLQSSIERGRTTAPQVAAEYARIGSLNGSETFDDRSTAFGVGSLTFSHGVSDIAGVLRYIWLAAGGADTLQLPPLDDHHLILVGRGKRTD